MQEFQPKNKEGQYISAMDGEYQSKFMPIFQNAETQIKKLIIKYFWNLKSESELRAVIKQYITDINNKIPKDLPNRDAYIQGLIASSDKWIKQERKKRIEFAIILGLVAMSMAKAGQKMPKISTPQELTELIESKKINYRMWEQAKASVRVQNYPQQIKRYINQLTGEVLTTHETGKKSISLWQKAELDVRYAHQMEMLQNAIDSGNDLFWISSHPDCSDRCEKWQGKLVSVSKSSTMSGFRIGKVDGNWVYSLKEIMAQTDKYGYHNNIINGFNCRHHLIPYESGKKPPKEYSSQDVKKMRKIETTIRQKEREIRFYNQQSLLYNQRGDVKNARLSKLKANKLTQLLREYCNKNGFAFEEYRVK